MGGRRRHFLSVQQQSNEPGLSFIVPGLLTSMPPRCMSRHTQLNHHPHATIKTDSSSTSLISPKKLMMTYPAVSPETNLDASSCSRSTSPLIALARVLDYVPLVLICADDDENWLDDLPRICFRLLLRCIFWRRRSHTVHCFTYIGESVAANAR